MTKDTDKQPESKQPDGIDFEKAQQMTVGEAARAEADMKAGITEEDGVLDRYIKQHRDEVSAEKFDTKVAELEQLDTASLDEFIEKKKQELQELEEIEAQSQKEETASSEEVPQTPVEEAPVIDEIEVTPLVKKEEQEEAAQEEQAPSLEETFVEEDKQKRSRHIVWGGLIVLVLAIIAFCFTWFSNNKSQTTTSTSTSSTTKTSTSSSSSTKAAKEANSTFTKAYDAFFTDSSQTALKNSQFDQLSDLKTKLDALKNTSYYKAAKSKYDSLEAQIKAIQAVNAKFDSARVVDGSQTDATVKSDANFDDLDSSTLNTGNSTLDKLLQAAVTDGRAQLTSAQEAAAQAASSADTTASSAAATTDTTQAQSSTDSSQASSSQTVSAATSYGITNYDPAILQRDRSRVPYDFSKIADSSNSAWTFNAGVLEKILEISRQRGYITGNNFILERVNIINGNGYYNMFKPDGTYLFSINDKTGYFVGNAAGHSDALDY